jgi:uncharacterized membrane protein
MTNFVKHPFMDKIVSFIISIIIVLIIFVGIVGIIFPLMLEARIEYVRIISLMATLIGALIILLARRWPIFRFISFIKKPGDYEIKKGYDFIGSLIIGLSFLFAGALYMRTKNPNMIIIPFIGGAALIRILIFYFNNKIKKRRVEISTSPEKEE